MGEAPTMAPEAVAPARRRGARPRTPRASGRPRPRRRAGRGGGARSGGRGARGDAAARGAREPDGPGRTLSAETAEPRR